VLLALTWVALYLQKKLDWSERATLDESTEGGVVQEEAISEKQREKSPDM